VFHVHVFACYIKQRDSLPRIVASKVQTFTFAIVYLFRFRMTKFVSKTSYGKCCLSKIANIALILMSRQNKANNLKI